MAAINLWIDDERPAPEGWMWVKTVKEAIAAFENNTVADVGMDYCLLGGTADEIMYWLIDNPAHRPTGEIAPHSSSRSGNELIRLLTAELEKTAP